MNFPLFFFLLAALTGSSIWLGRRAAAKTDGHDDYFLMGRSLGFFPLMMTLLATQVGGGALLGTAEEAFRHGWAVACLPLGMALGLLFLGLGFGAKIRKLGVSTVAEVFEKVYGSRRLRQIAAVLSIASLFFILEGQAIAARKFFLSLGFESPWLFVAFWIVLVFYTVAGGLRAVVNTDVVQAGFIVVALGLAFFSCKTPGQVVPIEATGSVPWATWLLMPLFFMLISQHMGQRCAAAKSTRTITAAALTSATLFFALSLSPVFFGVRAAQAGLEIPAGSSVLLAAVQALTSPAVATCVTVALLMAILSTADSLLCSISSNLACDFNQRSVRFSKGVTLAVGLLCLGLSFLFDNVVAVLLLSYGLAGTALVVPLLLGAYWKAPSPLSAYASMATGATSFLFLSELPSILLSLLAFLLSEAVLKSLAVLRKT